MSASQIAFRLRYPIHICLYLLGFLAPWTLLSGGHSAEQTLWLAMAGWTTRQGWTSFSAGTEIPLLLATGFAWVGAGLRTWATAWMGAGPVGSGSMQGAKVVTDGPYRWLRHPLYVGLVLNTIALSLLMPLSGAVVCLVLVIAFDLWLAVSEEHFLRSQQDVAFLAYRSAVGAVVPRFRRPIARSGARPMWRDAVLHEIYFWGVAITFAAFGWRYNSFLLKQGVLVSFGLALVARAFLSRRGAVE